jgi:hypothetical protein
MAALMAEPRLAESVGRNYFRFLFAYNWNSATSRRGCQVERPSGRDPERSEGGEPAELALSEVEGRNPERSEGAPGSGSGFPACARRDTESLPQSSPHTSSGFLVKSMQFPAWRYRLGVRTEDSQSSNPGSIPGSATNPICQALAGMLYPSLSIAEAGFLRPQCRGELPASQGTPEAPAPATFISAFCARC